METEKEGDGSAVRGGRLVKLTETDGTVGLSQTGFEYVMFPRGKEQSLAIWETLKRQSTVINKVHKRLNTLASINKK